MATNSEIVETPDTEEASQLDNLERLSVILSRIESSKQQTALAQIQANNEDNERQYEFAKLQAENAKDRWNKSLLIGAVSAGVLAITGLYLTITGETALGLGLLSNTFTGVFAYLAGAGANR